ncbi:hypothetical protein WDW37_12640 [Bdellovibrionota bacterium FG-1]
MQTESAKSREDIYRDFLEFVSVDIQRERLLVHRKMFHVFFWCFLLPALVSVSTLVLIKLHVLPLKAKAIRDWLVLIFPVSYSLYILGLEVLARVPVVLKRGGISGTLGQAAKESQWRERVRVEMDRAVRASTDQWKWIIENFRIDLAALQNRMRYLTALAGAVFFLIMQGIDSLGDGTSAVETSVSWTRNPITGWVETSAYDFSQFVGLLLFLGLLYLSGSQTYHSLRRYLHCAELGLLDTSASDRSRRH